MGTSADLSLFELKRRLSSSFYERFSLEDELGAGAFGLVVRAQQIALKRPVAIKFLLDKEATQLEALKRFKREAQTLAQLRHPNIVQVSSSERTMESHSSSRSYSMAAL